MTAGQNPELHKLCRTQMAQNPPLVNDRREKYREQNGMFGPYSDPGSDKPIGRKKDTIKEILLLAGYFIIMLSNYR